MTREECDAVQRQLRDDVDSRRLIPISNDLDEVVTQASAGERLEIVDIKRSARPKR